MKNETWFFLQIVQADDEQEEKKKKKNERCWAYPPTVGNLSKNRH